MNLTVEETQTRMEQIQEAVEKKVYTPLAGMKSTYEKIVKNYHDIMRDDRFTADFKLVKKDEAREYIRVLKRDSVEEALANLEEVEEKFRLKSGIDEMSETEKLTRVTIWTNVLPQIEKEEFMELYEKYQHDPDFEALAKAAMKKRNLESWLQEFGILKQNDPMVEYFNGARKFVRALGDMGAWIMLIDEQGLLIYQANSDNDLDNVRVTSIFENVTDNVEIQVEG